MNRFVRIALALTICVVSGTSAAYAQATRTWVSGVGDDVNPCSRTAPCKTFAGAISKTAPFGEISTLDPGGFGPVTITKSITLNGVGTLAGILGNTSGVVINGAGVVVVLRDLSILGVGSSTTNGISLFNGAAVIVDHVTIAGFETGISTTVGNAVVTNSSITQNRGFGVHALGGSITLENSQLANNGVAVQAETGATVRLTNNSVYNNLTGFGCGGGTLASTGDNRKGNNVGGVVAACAPNATIALQ